MGEDTEHTLGFMPPSRLSGEEAIRLPRGSSVGQVRDFWAWAYSDLLNNVERGVFAEFLVSLALHGARNVRASWDPYDVRTPEGVRVEVKSASHLQSWSQREYSRIRFGVQPTTAWDPHTNRFVGEPRRHADVYVFCLLVEKNPQVVDPLELDQWEFYVLPTSILDDQLPIQKTLSMNALLALGPEKCGFEGLAKTVAEVGTAGRS